jgi:hypothetical protein
MSNSTSSDEVIQRALAEVAASRALRERMAKRREENFSRIPTRQSVYVLSRQAKAKSEAEGKPSCAH